MASFSPPAHRPSLGLSLDLDDVLSSWEETGTGSIFAADLDACCYDRSGSNLSNSDMLYQHWDEPDAEQLLDLTAAQASLHQPIPTAVPKIDIMPFLLQQQPHTGMVPTAQDSHIMNTAQLPPGFPLPGAPSSSSNPCHKLVGIPQPSGTGMNGMTTLRLPSHRCNSGPAGSGMVPSPFSSNSSTPMNAGFSPMGGPSMRPHLPQPGPFDCVLPHCSPMLDQLQHMRSSPQHMTAFRGGMPFGNPLPGCDMRAFNFADRQAVTNQQQFMMPGGHSFIKSEPLPIQPGYNASRQIQAVPTQLPAPCEGRMSNDVPAYLKLHHLKKEPQNSCTSSSSTELSTMSESVLHMSGRSRNTTANCLDLRCPPVHAPIPGTAASLPVSQASTMLNLAMPSDPAHNSGCGTPTTGGSPGGIHSFAMRANTAPPNSPAGAAAHQLASRLCLASCSPDVLVPQGSSPLATQLTVRPPSVDGASPTARTATPGPARLPEIMVPPATDLCLVQPQPTLELTNSSSDTAEDQTPPFSHMPVDWVRIRTQALERYREKRARRAYTKKIRYQLRKINADRRPRIKGRFVKKEEMHLYAHLIKRGKGAPAEDEPCEGSCNQPACDEGVMEEDDAAFGVVPEFDEDPMACVTGFGSVKDYPMDLKLELDGMVPVLDNPLVGW